MMDERMNVIPIERRNVEEPTTPLTANELLKTLREHFNTPAGVDVTVEKALAVPAFAAAVHFFSDTIAKLPLHVHRRKAQGDEREGSTALNKLLHEQVNDDCSSFEWRAHGIVSMLTRKRWLSWIERNKAGLPVNIWPIDPGDFKRLERKNGLRRYIIERDGREQTFMHDEIIDVPYQILPNRLNAICPFDNLTTTIGVWIAIENYSAGLFKNGGVPPLSLQGNFQSGAAVKRAAADVEGAVRQVAQEGGAILPLPMNHALEKIGFEPEKAQMIEMRRLLIEEIARGFNLPPIFLQDLTHGTFSNSEQQDLHLVKHTLTGLVRAIESQLDMKLFQRGKRQRFTRFNVDGLLRGEFDKRMQGYQTAINSGVMQPSEAREREKLPFAEHSDQLFMQGATVPLGDAGNESK